MLRRVILRAMVTVAVSTVAVTQLRGQVPAEGPVFDVVSIKKVPAGTFGGGPIRVRPDGGMSLTAPASSLVRMAYASTDGPFDIVGLPDWASRDSYNMTATSSLPKATPEDRKAMLRAMLADRFKLLAHLERRELPVYDLVRARSDGRLGPGLTPIEADCAAKLAADRVAAEAAIATGTPIVPQRPDLNAPPPPCTLRSVGARDGKSDRLEGEGPISSLAILLRLPAGRFVIDKTGLMGSYSMQMLFSVRASRGGPDVASADADLAPSVFTAIRDLGLRLESSKAEADVVVIDHLEPPTEN